MTPTIPTSQPILDIKMLSINPRATAIAAYLSIGYTRTEALRLARGIRSRAAA
jgi:hypothetical protein